MKPPSLWSAAPLVDGAGRRPKAGASVQKRVVSLRVCRCGHQRRAGLTSDTPLPLMMPSSRSSTVRLSDKSLKFRPLTLLTLQSSLGTLEQPLNDRLEERPRKARGSGNTPCTLSPLHQGRESAKVGRSSLSSRAARTLALNLVAAVSTLSAAIVCRCDQMANWSGGFVAGDQGGRDTDVQIWSNGSRPSSRNSEMASFCSGTQRACPGHLRRR